LRVRPPVPARASVLRPRPRAGDLPRPARRSSCATSSPTCSSR
jgi:hypothetical protein